MGLSRNRFPATLAEVRAMVAYNERILATSRSASRRESARRMIANLLPHVERLSRDRTPGKDADAATAPIE